MNKNKTNYKGEIFMKKNGYEIVNEALYQTHVTPKEDKDMDITTLKTMGKGALVGAGTGAAIGLTAGVIAKLRNQGIPASYIAQVAAKAAAAGIPVGGMVGAIVGSWKARNKIIADREAKGKE